MRRRGKKPSTSESWRSPKLVRIDTVRYINVCEWDDGESIEWYTYLHAENQKKKAERTSLAGYIVENLSSWETGFSLENGINVADTE